MKPCNSLFLAGFVGAIALWSGCIERDNEWDPYNGCHSVYELPIYQDSVKRAIEKIKTVISYTDIDMGKLNEDFNVQIVTNDESALSNTQTHILINNLLDKNSAIDSLNRSVPTDSAINKLTILQRLVPMQRARTTPQGQITIALARDSVEYWIRAAEAYCPKQTVLTSSYIDSTRDSLDARADWWNRELESIYAYNNRMRDSNRVVDSINAVAHFHDSLVAIYNDSLRFCKIPQIVDPIEIKRQIDSIAPGTVIAIGADSVNVPNLQIVRKGAVGIWTAIEGLPGRKTLLHLTSGPVEISASFHIRFTNIIFLGNGAGPDVRITSESDSIVFSKCEFIGAGSYGAEATNCNNVKFENCVFLRNGNPQDTGKNKAGLRLDECRGTINFVNVLIAKNYGCGIDINRCNVFMTNVTIAGNTLDGMRFTGPNGTGSFYAKQVLFAHNGGYGIYRNNENVSRDIWAGNEDGNRFYGNNPDAMGGSPLNISENRPFIDDDPAFINSADGDYHIGPSSTLYWSDIGYLYP